MGITRMIDSVIPFFFDIDQATRVPPDPGVDKPMDNLDTQLRTALDAWIRKEVQPAQEAIDDLRKAADVYEKAALEDAQIRAQHAALAALGASEGVRISLPLVQAKDDLLGAVTALRELLAPECCPCGVPLDQVCLTCFPEDDDPTPAKHKAERTAQQADPADLEEARLFLQEVDKTDYDNMHTVRMAHALQIHVAECRRLMEAIPISHTMHQVLVQTLRRLGGVRGTANCDVFIKGLARHHHDNWSRVVQKSRDALAKYDADAAQGPNSAPLSKKPKNGKVLDRDSSAPESVDLPKLLMAQEMGRIVVLFGGIRIPEKIKTIKDRTGLSIDWSEAEEGSPRNANIGVSRIRKDNISCVVILEGLISHGVWRSVADQCTAEGIPHVMGGRGGIGSVIQVLETVEAKL